MIILLVTLPVRSDDCSFALYKETRMTPLANQSGLTQLFPFPWPVSPITGKTWVVNSGACVVNFESRGQANATGPALEFANIKLGMEVQLNVTHSRKQGSLKYRVVLLLSYSSELLLQQQNIVAKLQSLRLVYENVSGASTTLNLTSTQIQQIADQVNVGINKTLHSTVAEKLGQEYASWRECLLPFSYNYTFRDVVVPVNMTATQLEIKQDGSVSISINGSISQTYACQYISIQEPDSKSSYFSLAFLQNLLTYAQRKGYAHRLRLDSNNWKTPIFSYSLYQVSFFAPEVLSLQPAPNQLAHLQCSTGQLLGSAAAEGNTLSHMSEWECELKRSKDGSPLVNFSISLSYSIKVRQLKGVVKAQVSSAKLLRLRLGESKFKVEEGWLLEEYLREGLQAMLGSEVPGSGFLQPDRGCPQTEMNPGFIRITDGCAVQ